ncbi:hypothetical protein EZS27_016964 [termite gut metagenome]|uniref:Uncharacterized protein n=1 Tax=termite gut metagenome TaxID=433724 RepID=A0A5J4RM75_9ZZZZ
MGIDEKKIRLEKAINYLIGVQILSRQSAQSDLAEKMKSSNTNISRAINGNIRYLTDKFLKRFNQTFENIFNDSWLLTGEGDMINENTQTVEGVNNTTLGITGDGNNITHNDIVGMLNLASGYQGIIKNNQSHLDKSQEHIDKLLAENKDYKEKLFRILDKYLAKE